MRRKETGVSRPPPKANESSDELLDSVPHRGRRVDEVGRQELGPALTYNPDRRRLFGLLAAAGGGAIAAVLGQRLLSDSVALPGSATGGTTISDTDIDAKRIAGVRIASEFAASPHAGTAADPFPGAAIQAAINDLPSTGGLVFIPSGFYNVSSPLSITRSNVTLSGAGAGSYLKTDGIGYTRNVSSMIGVFGNGNLDSLTGVIIEKLQLDGTNTDTNFGVFVSLGARALIRDMVIRNFLGTDTNRARGISIEQNPPNASPPYSECVVSDCDLLNNQIGIVLHRTRFSLHGTRCLNNVWDGIYVDGDTGQGAMVGNVVEFSGRTGINIIGGERISIADNYLYQNFINMTLSGCHRLSVMGNILEAAGGGGVGIFVTPSPDAIPSADNVILGNWIYNNIRTADAHGIYLYTGHVRNSIIGNVISNMNRNGIYLWGGSNDNLIEGNMCLDNGQSGSGFAGIFLQDSSGNVVRGNRCFDDQTLKTQSYGIAEAGTSTGNYVLDNDLLGNAAAGLVSPGTSTIRRNIGYPTETRGTATIVNGQNAVQVPHGLVATPRLVLLGPKSLVGAGAVWAADATNITITVPNVVPTDTAIAWSAEV